MLVLKSYVILLFSTAFITASTNSGFLDLWQSTGINILVLLFGSCLGFIARGVVKPEPNRKRLVQQGFVGLLNGVGLGGFFGSLTDRMISEPVFAYLAAGFICAFSGELAMQAAQRKFFGTDDDDHQRERRSTPRRSYQQSEGRTPRPVNRRSSDQVIGEEFDNE